MAKMVVDDINANGLLGRQLALYVEDGADLPTTLLESGIVELQGKRCRRGREAVRAGHTDGAQPFALMSSSWQSL